MSYESVRAATATHVNTQWIAAATGVPMEFDNIASIDHDSKTDPFVTFMLKWRGDASQASLENVPITRYDGEAQFHIHVPSNKGTKVGLQLADVIAGFMKYVELDRVKFQAPRLLPHADYKDWVIYPIFVSFCYKE